MGPKSNMEVLNDISDLILLPFLALPTASNAIFAFENPSKLLQNSISYVLLFKKYKTLILRTPIERNAYFTLSFFCTIPLKTQKKTIVQTSF